MIYLDHAATSFPKAPGVSAAVAGFLDEAAGNPGRGGHRLSVRASRIIEDARERVGRLLGGSMERTLFGPGATFWLSTVLSAWLQAGDRVVTTVLEHNAVMRPLRHLERTLGVRVAAIAGEARSGVPTASEIADAAHREPTRLVVLTHVSNVTGAALPVADIVHAVAPVPVLVDGAQSAGSLPVDFASLGAAAFVCSGHKGLLGPPGVGVLLLAEGVDVEPLVRGGTGSRSASHDMPDHLPDRLEAGTPNGAGIAGLGAACRWIEASGVAALHHRVDALTRRMENGLATVPGARVHGIDPAAPRTGILSFTVDGLDSGEAADRLDREDGIMLRAGLHCAPSAHEHLGTLPHGTLRASAGPFTTAADVDALLAALTRLTATGSGP